ncbi:RIP metalloprotease [Patescibacteria group bacterium]
MISLLIFLLILSVLILVHELGHFAVAKKSGVLVEEFGLGIPPRLFSKKIGETTYSINALPFGGFVKLYGEDDENENTQNNPKSFLNKSTGWRACIIVAGVSMNLLLGLVLYTVFFFSTGNKSMTIPVFFDHKFKFGEPVYINTVITDFMEGSYGEGAGLRVGDIVLEIDNTPVYSVEDIRNTMSGKKEMEVSLLVRDSQDLRGEGSRVVNTTPVLNSEGEARLGVYLSEAVNIVYPSTISAGPMHAYNMMAYTFNTFGEFIKISLDTKSIKPVSSGVAGPIGIYSIVDAILTYDRANAVLSLIDLTALMSLSLAFLNVLPLPALDGGRLLFIMIEKVTGKRVHQKFEAAVHRWGLVFFLSLLALITIKDIFRIVL